MGAGRLILLAILFASVASLDIVVFASAVAGSHLSYFSAVINTLTGAGHSVDFVCALVNDRLTNAGKNNASNTVVVKFSGRSPWNSGSAHLDDPFKDTSSWNPFESVFLRYEDAALAMHALVLDSEEVRALLTSKKYDMGFATASDYIGITLLRAYNVSPIISYSTMGLFQWSVLTGGYAELPWIENAILDARPNDDRHSFFYRLMAMLRSFHDHYFFSAHTMATNKLLRTRFGQEFPDAAKIAVNVSLDLVNSSPFLDRGRPITSRVKYIGGLQLKTTKEQLPEEYENILSRSKKGVVLFSFGTQVPASQKCPAIREAFLGAFKRLPDFDFVWKLDDLPQFGVPNVHVFANLPQRALLADPRVVAFISHMGLNSYIEASLLGVPLVSIPLFVDQFHNARVAVEMGTGVLLRKTALTEDAIYNALKALLHNPSFRDNAASLASLMQSSTETPERTLLEAVELAAKNKDLHKFNTHVGSGARPFVLHGYDLIAFLILLAFIMVYLLTKLLFFASVRNKVKLD